MSSGVTYTGPPLPPFSPQADCPKCSSEGASVTYHPSGFIGFACWPASPASARVHQPHVCKQCHRCGYDWCEQTADAYAGQDPEEDPMSIKKTAAAGEVLGTDEQGIVKTAAPDAAWAAEDESALADENADADQA